MIDKNLDYKRLKYEYDALLKGMNEILTPQSIHRILAVKDELMKKYRVPFAGWDDK